MTEGATEGVTESIIERDRRFIMGTYNRSPVVIVRGRGTLVWDVDGREYLDFVAGISVNSLGHCHPAVVQAIGDQAAELLHCSNLYHSRPQVLLAERLADLAGGGKVFFCQSGAEATEAAIKLARKRFWRRGHEGSGAVPKVISFTNAFHGRTLAALAATGRYLAGFAPLPAGFVQVPFNDLDAAEAAIDEEVCAVIVEAVQGEGGVVPAAPGFLEGLRRLCDRSGALLILDEVQTGLGRTGKWFGYEHFGVRPDVVTLAKALGSGLPIGAVVARDGVGETFEPGDHGSTFGGNPVACAAALAGLDVMVSEDLPARAAAAGGYLQSCLDTLAGEYRFIREVRGFGLMQGVEFTFPCRHLVDLCRREGLLVNVTAERVLRFLPPLTVSEEEIDRAVEILDRVLSGLPRQPV